MFVEELPSLYTNPELTMQMLPLATEVYKMFEQDILMKKFIYHHITTYSEPLQDQDMMLVYITLWHMSPFISKTKLKHIEDTVHTSIVASTKYLTTSY